MPMEPRRANEASEGAEEEATGVVEHVGAEECSGFGGDRTNDAVDEQYHSKKLGDTTTSNAITMRNAT
jgi:hypothetical protein